MQTSEESDIGYYGDHNIRRTSLIIGERPGWLENVLDGWRTS